MSDNGQHQSTGSQPDRDWGEDSEEVIVVAGDAAPLLHAGTGKMANYERGSVFIFPPDCLSRLRRWRGIKAARAESDLWVLYECEPGTPKPAVLRPINNGPLGCSSSHPYDTDTFGMSQTSFEWTDDNDTLMARPLERNPVGPSSKRYSSQPVSKKLEPVEQEIEDRMAARMEAYRVAAVAVAAALPEPEPEPEPVVTPEPELLPEEHAADNGVLMTMGEHLLREVLDQINAVEGLTPYRLVRLEDGAWGFAAPVIRSP